MARSMDAQNIPVPVGFGATDVIDGNSALELARLRAEFDNSFAVEPTLETDANDLALAIRAGGQRHIVNLTEIAAIHECPKIVPLPSNLPGFLGVVGLRGRLHGVFRLSTLLGLPTMATHKSWLVLALAEDAPAFVVDEIDACLTFTSTDLQPLENPNDHIRALFVRDDIVRNVLHLPSLVARVTAGMQTSRNPGVA